MLRGLAAALMLAVTVTALPAFAQGPGYQVVSSGPDGIELRFHGMALRGVHADDAQNALSLDFQTPVDGSAFDSLPAQMPAWVSMAYANFDNGIIRSPRPVTFLTRAEPDGFSLRIVPRGAAPGGFNAPPQQPMPMQGPPPQQYAQQPYPPQQAYAPPQPYAPQGATPFAPYPNANGQYAAPLGQPMPPQGYVPPAYQAGFHTYGDYAALRAYEAQELAIRRADPVWAAAYGRAAMQSGSGFSIGSEWNEFHGGDRMVHTDLKGKISFVDGVALVGDGKWTDVTGFFVRQPNGTIVNPVNKDIFSGEAGFAFELGRDSELKLQGTLGNNVAGGKLDLYSGTPQGFGFLTVAYHNPDVDTPTAVSYKAQKDQASLGYGGQIAWGLWGSISGTGTEYGVHGDSNVARTAGWDANLRWGTEIFGGLLAGISYDGHGEYRIDYDTRTGSAPTPFVPLGIRNMENHAATATLSAVFMDQVWIGGYIGYVTDRYAADGLLAGVDIHYNPMPGVDIAIGARQSAVSYVEGETGRQTTAGVNLTLGFGAPPAPSWVSNQL